MAYDISGKASSARAARPEEKKNDTPKIIFSVAALLIGGYFLLAGQIGLFPFSGAAPEPAAPSESEQAAMKNAPVTPKQMPHIQEIEAMPEAKRPVKSGA